jgi:hypothetical protein
MAQATFTPIQLYYSANGGATPSTTNLAAGELAINITDGKLFYKDNSGSLQTIATKAAATNPLPVNTGGTGIQTLTQGGIAYGGATTYLFTAVGTTGDLLSSNGTGAPTWITPTNANTPSTIVKRDASGNFAAGTITASLAGTASTATNLASGAAGSIPYQSGVGATTFLAAGASGTVLTMSSGGVPTWTTAGTSTLASNLAGGTAGALAYQSAVNATAFLAPGTSGQILTLNSSQIPAWSTLSFPSSVANITGGAAGSLPYQSASSTTTFLAAGTSGQVLTLTSAQIPAWTTPGSVSSVANLSGGATNKIPYQSNVGSTTFIDAPTGSSYLKYNGSAFTWDNPVTGVSAGTGMSFTTITGTGSVAIDTTVVPRFSNAGTFTATQTFAGSSSVPSMILDNALEACTVTGSAISGAINIDIATQSVIFYNTATTNPWSLNFRASSGTPLSSFMSQGQSVTVAVLAQIGAVTSAYNSALSVGGSAVTIDGAAPAALRWQGGTAPTSGNANSIDVYTYTIIRTGPSSYTVLAAQIRFA